VSEGIGGLWLAVPEWRITKGSLTI